MSKPGKARFKLEALRTQATESLGVEPGYVIELDDGTEINIPNPLFVDDDMQEKLEDADSTIDLAKAVLGDEDYERFRASGGRANDIALAWQMMQKSAESVLPNGNPTRR
jgi:hypothetical protein